MRPDERAKVAEGAFELSFPEIVKFVEKNFRTLANKKNRAIAGLSMGSFHSCNISKYYPDMFDYVGLSPVQVPGTINQLVRSIPTLKVS